jgi:hypothetical protein
LSVALNQPNAWVFVVLAVLTVGAVIWFYRRTPPSTSGRLRLLFIFLRAVALLLLFAALIEPVVAINRVITERPVVAVLLDVSESMSIRDGAGGVRRGDEAVSLLNEVVLPRIARDTELVAYEFSAGMSELDLENRSLPVGLPLDGEATDIAAALSGLSTAFRGRNLGAVVVATDGASNRGARPAEAAAALGVPVFALGVGSTEAGTDIAVVDAVTNRISYSGERVPIEVTVASSGFEGAETVVELSENGVQLDSDQIDLSGTGEEVRVTFHVTPTEPGTHTYTVAVPPADGELTTANNTRLVVTNAMKGKIRVLLAGQRPSWEYAFMKRALEADRNMEVTSAIVAPDPGGSATPPSYGTRPDELPSSAAELSAYDLVILVEADWERPPVGAEPLHAFVSERGGGLLLLGPPEGRVPESAHSVLAVELDGPILEATSDARLRLTALGQSAPSMRLVSDKLDNVDLWQSLPPLRVPAVASWSAPADADVLAESGVGNTRPDAGSGDSNGRATPVIVTRPLGAGTVMSFMAEELWRWKMAADDDGAYDRLVSNVARLLTARGELDRVVLEPGKDVYRSGEEVSFSAQVYGADYRLTGDAEVAVDVSSGERAAPVASVLLDPEGDFYRGAAGVLPPGRYVASATAAIAGEDVGTAEARFAVEPFSLEDAETRRRSALLRRIADDTGGGYYSPETLEELPADVPMAWTQRQLSREFEIWNSPWLLAGFVGLMSAEWALRRKQGLP